MSEPQIGEWWEPDPESDAFFAGCSDSCCTGRFLILDIENGAVAYEVHHREATYFDEDEIGYFMHNKRLAIPLEKKRSGFAKFMMKIECKEVSDG